MKRSLIKAAAVAAILALGGASPMTYSLGVVSTAVILAKVGASPANSMTMADGYLQIGLLRRLRNPQPSVGAPS